MQRLNRVSLRALRAVEAVARLGSLARAADELRVSPGAVSQQVTQAEASLGFPLFERKPSGMSVTPRAREVCGLLTAGFSRLEEALSRAESEHDEVLTISVAPVFAARWLIWRLPAFQSAHPEAKVRLDASLALVDPGHGDVDLCIRVSRGDWPNVDAELLFPQIIFPVCAPALAARLSTPADLVSVPIIREPRPNFDWADWLAVGEPEADDLPEGPVFSDASLCLDAAVSGSGVLLTFETLAYDALEHGRLVEPFNRRRATANAYWLVTSPARRPPPLVGRFRTWLKGEIAKAGFGTQRPG
jgi:DNA-binding transcriptional LysR family regulator